MDVSLASWLVIALALAAANLPFLNERLFGLVALPSKQGGPPNKHAFVRVGEMTVLYFLVGGVAWALEAQLGNVFAQEKEFYMITVPLFVVLAFPGFVLRYLRKHRD